MTRPDAGMKIGACGFLLTIAAAAFFAAVYSLASVVLPPWMDHLPLVMAVAITQPLFLFVINVWAKWVNS